MALPDIKKQIAAVPKATMRAIQDKFTQGQIRPYEYQVVAYIETMKRLQNYKHPFIIKASVSAGKTLMFAMVFKQLQSMGLPALLLSRQREIVRQDADDMKEQGVKLSIYCAGLNEKSAHYDIIVGSEGTVARGLDKALGDFCPKVIGIDECHMVDWEDLYWAIRNNESVEQAINGKRSLYTIIILTMMKRCREKYGTDLRVFGMTGSEYRGVVPIVVENERVPGFWREQATNIDTNYLVEFGSVVPVVFGDNSGLGYDLSEFHASSEDGVKDFDVKTLKAMSDKIHGDQTMTQKIMTYVHEVAKERGGVLVTCADRRHCREAAAALPEDATWCIIDGNTSEKERDEKLQEAFNGKIKYVFQVAALTTGVNVPYWDTCVILRKISSLTLLVQLIGRIMRKLKGWQVDAGWQKDHGLVLDFGGAMDELADLYFDPMLEDYQFQMKGKGDKDPKFCEICGTENSGYARRCVHRDENGNRCEHFWSFRLCGYDKDGNKLPDGGCETKNDPCARFCRHCGKPLIDPNDNLSGKSYTINDWCEVRGFRVTMTKNMTGIVVAYDLENQFGENFKAYERFFPESDNHICRAKWWQFLKQHVTDVKAKGYMAKVKNAQKIMAYSHFVRQPVRVTHRSSKKQGDIIHRKEF